MFFSRLSIVYGGSLLLHAGVALAVASIHVPARHEPTKISIREVTRPKPATPAVPPPAVAPPPLSALAKPKTAKPAPKRAAPAPSAAPPSAASPGPSIPDFGLSLGGAVGAGGVAIPLANQPASDSVRTTRAAPKALTKTHAAAESGCSEELTKPKPLSVPQPVYPQQARAAGITGKVRVELSVDERGQVISARVLEGLGHGLDEAALEAAAAARFEPATRCGRPTKTSFVIGMRFTL